MRRTAAVLASVAPVVSVVCVSLAAVSAGCHRTQAAQPPLDGPDSQASFDPVTSSRIDAGDPSVVSAAGNSVSQIEPHIVVAPNGTTVLAWMASRPGAPTVIGARFSRDRGDTWEPVLTVAAPEGRWSSEPVLATDEKGTISLAWLGSEHETATGDIGDTHVYVARAEAGANRFGPPVDASGPMPRGSTLEKPWLTVAASGITLVSWGYANAQSGNGISVARSTDGQTWVPQVVLQRVGLQASLPYVCTSHKGERVWIVYLDSEVGVRIRGSDDGGVVWAPSRVATVSAGEMRARIAADGPVCVGDGDDVVVAFGRTKEKRDQARSAGLDEIVVARSGDGGRSFDWRRLVDAGDALAMHPQIVREPDGAIDVAYYAGGASLETGTLRVARLPDKAKQFGPSRVVREHVRFARGRTDKGWPGDYFGFAARDGTLFLATIDAPGEEPHVAFTKFAAR